MHRSTLRVLGALAAFAVLAFAGQSATAASWTVDNAHSEVNFSINHFFTPVTGGFGEFEIDLDYNEDDPAASSVSATIQVASVDTGNERRDGHLKTGDFFDAETYPTITFESTSVRAEGDGLVATGNLTIRDQTSEVELPIQILGVQEIPEEMRERMGGSEKVAGFKADLAIDRGDYGVGSGNFAATLVVGGEVRIELLVEAHLRP